MSFLKKLFGGGGGRSAEAPVADPVEYRGYTILPTPFVQEGPYQTCGVVSVGTGAERREHRFIRADRFASAEGAIQHSIRKGKQLVDEQGERMFGGT